MQTAEQLEPIGVISHLTSDYKVAFMCDKILYLMKHNTKYVNVAK